MSVKTEKLEEKNMIKLTVEVPAEDFNEAIKKAYNQNKGLQVLPLFTLPVHTSEIHGIL